jgi:hypothetical protein
MAEVRAVASFSTIVHSGHPDLFFAFMVFLPLALLMSASSIGMNVRLLLRHIAERRAELQAPTRLPSSRRLSQLQTEGQSASQPADAGLPSSLHWLVKRYVLHRAQVKHQEGLRAYRISLSHFYVAMMLLLLEDLPFFTIGTIQLIRSLRDRNNQMIIDEHRLCSAGYNVNFNLVLLNTLKSAGMFAIKLHKLQGFPPLLQQKQALRKAQHHLHELAAELELARSDGHSDPRGTHPHQHTNWPWAPRWRAPLAKRLH